MDNLGLRVYLDTCCLNRLTDDPSQDRIRQETAAVQRVLDGIQLGTIVWIASEALHDEVQRNPIVERRAEAETLLSFASESVPVDERISRRATELFRLGYQAYDALHISICEFSSVDVMLSTDDRLIRRVARGLGRPRIPVRNPVSWCQEALS
jgi:predicted nucleic acid-binding protein